MKRFRSVLLVPLIATLTALAPISVTPEYRINMSAFSDKILLVDVTKVSLTEEKVENGIGSRDVTVEGSLVEVIRGEQQKGKFHSCGQLTRVVDATAAEVKYGAQTLELLSFAQIDQSGRSECKEGKRYVVSYAGSDSRFQGEFFTEVAKDNEDWRKKILPRKHSEEEPPKVK